MIAKKIIIQNLSITAISKIFGFALFLFVARGLSAADYGAFVYINMLLSLLPLLQFGSMHGAVILLPKYIADKSRNPAKLFSNFNGFSHLIQIFSVFALLLFNIEVSPWVLAVIAFNFILSKHTENTKIYLNAKLKFEKANILKLIDQILKPIITLFFFYYYKNIEAVFSGQLLATFIAFFLSVYFEPFRFLKQGDKNFFYSIKNLYRIGFFVYLVWAIDIVFRTADRWFISQFYSLEDLAEYGFSSALAMNIWMVSMSFFAPYSQILYKHVAERRFSEVKMVVEGTNKKLYMLISISAAAAVVFYPYLIEFVIQKYFGSYLLFCSLALVSVLLSINNMYIYYMISNHFHFTLLKYQAFVLLVNLLLNTMFSLFRLDIIYFSYSTILSLAIYYILVRKYFYKNIAEKLTELGR